MAWQYTYGDIKPVVFRLINSDGDKVTTHTFVNADLYWIAMDETLTWGTWTADGLNVTNIGRGLYVWTPDAASKTQNELVVLDIEDSTGSTFLDNCKIVMVGGDPDAYLDG